MAKRGETGTFAFAAREPDPVVASLFVDVALNRPVRCEFTYGVPDEFIDKVAPGMRVAVPLGPRREVGVVVALRTECALEPSKIKNVALVLDDEALVGPDLLELTRWMASYYACSWGEALSAVLPASLKHERGVRQVTLVSAAPGATPEKLAEIETTHPKHHRMLRTLIDLGGQIELRDLCRRINLSAAFAKTLEKKGLVVIARVDAETDVLSGSSVVRRRPDVLSRDQTAALAAITQCVAAGEYQTFLLQGVTGSGKTEVYLRVIENALALGKGAIVIVPEIALTPQTVGWFKSRFGDVAVLHSRLTDAQRRTMWQRVKRGECRVVVGARSAVFAPVANLGVIVVDEEHEPSFKQESTPRYHARDVAVMRANHGRCVCVLGSATPSLESWTNAKSGRYAHLHLRERVQGGKLPKVDVVDLRAEAAEVKGPALFSRRLKELLTATLKRKEQSILFLNRRGFSPTLWCKSCGESVRCKNCDMALTLHKRIGRIVCHACCEEVRPPKSCPACTSPQLRYLGAGSERIETAIGEFLPGARIARMDSDTMLRREDYEDVLERFGRGEIDVLVGTQMIAKGLDFPRVTLVGIISADHALHMPDFRASERTFQLLAQVSGRAGRGELAGQIVVQTSTPGHAAIRFATTHDFEGFAAQETRLRNDLGYPPFGRLMRIVFEDDDSSRVATAAAECAALVKAPAAAEQVKILGPAEAPIAMLRGRTRHHMLLKADATGRGLPRLRGLIQDWSETRLRPKVLIDVDPVSML
ncbi:MAG: primosomal protein N' [Planctomycetes bacterium]|nr:primosomal protein N' [Planctomycetota bacterium]